MSPREGGRHNIVSKILDRVVYDQVESYFKDKNLIYEFHSGFRNGFSTDTCLIYLTCYIRSENDCRKGNVVGMVLLDLQKAFDTVDHSILMMKLHATGLAEDILRWFGSYNYVKQTTTSRYLRYIFFYSSCNVWCSSGIYSGSSAISDLCE